MNLENVDYRQTFITVAPDSEAEAAPPPLRAGKPTIASATWRLLHDNPYKLTSGDVIFTVWADRQSIPEDQREAARREYFSTGRPCLRASDLGKKYGWGIHADAAAKLAIYAVGSEEYAMLENGTAPDGSAVKVLRAMRSKR